MLEKDSVEVSVMVSVIVDKVVEFAAEELVVEFGNIAAALELEGVLVVVTGVLDASVKLQELVVLERDDVVVSVMVSVIVDKLVEFAAEELVVEFGNIAAALELEGVLVGLVNRVVLGELGKENE
jgi:uncharacterized membrane protein YjfL (UPF0719 family)